MAVPSNKMRKFKGGKKCVGKRRIKVGSHLSPLFLERSECKVKRAKSENRSSEEEKETTGHPTNSSLSGLFASM